jgi:hypothetical protein
MTWGGNNTFRRLRDIDNDTIKETLVSTIQARDHPRAIYVWMITALLQNLAPQNEIVDRKFEPRSADACRSRHLKSTIPRAGDAER